MPTTTITEQPTAAQIAASNSFFFDATIKAGSVIWPMLGGQCAITLTEDTKYHINARSNNCVYIYIDVNGQGFGAYLVDCIEYATALAKIETPVEEAVAEVNIAAPAPKVADDDDNPFGCTPEQDAAITAKVKSDWNTGVARMLAMTDEEREHHEDWLTERNGCLADDI